MAPRWVVPAVLALADAMCGAGATASSHWASDASGLFQRVLEAAGNRNGAHRNGALRTEPKADDKIEYAEGDKAQVFIETGTYADTWVPVTINRKSGSGWYEVRLMASTSQKKKNPSNFTDVSGIKSTYLRQVDPAVYEASLADFLQRNDSTAMAWQVDRESKRRSRALAALKRERDYAKEVMSKGCPGEYIILGNNLPGVDQFGKGRKNLQSSAEGCARECDKTEGCKAFEWNPLNTVCLMRTSGEPKPGYVDGGFMFCQKFVYVPPSPSNSTEVATPAVNATPAAAAPVP